MHGCELPIPGGETTGLATHQGERDMSRLTKERLIDALVTAGLLAGSAFIGILLAYRG